MLDNPQQSITTIDAGTFVPINISALLAMESMILNGNKNALIKGCSADMQSYVRKGHQ